MAREYAASAYTTPYGTSSYANSASRQFTTGFIQLRICEKRNLRDLQSFETVRSQTIAQLKRSIATVLRVTRSEDELFLEVYDSILYQWDQISNTQSTQSVNDSLLTENSIVSLNYKDKLLSISSYTSYALPNSNNNNRLTLMLCEKPLNKSSYSFIHANLSSTLGELRKQMYTELYKQAKNYPIYIWRKDSWTKYDSEMDENVIANLLIEQYSFVSIDYDENTSVSKRPKGLCGLANFGSTCFMNSVFQCLSNTPEFTDKILCLSDEINAPIIGEYKKLIQKIWSGQVRDTEPRELVDNIQNQLPRYTTYRQQDAQEFMHHFLHLIHDELSTKETIITELFYGQMRSTVKCLKCQQIEIRTESISSLPLAISNHNQKSIRYIKIDGEQRFVSIQVNSSVYDVGDLIKCFIKQHEPKLKKEDIEAVQLANNRVIKVCGTYESLRFLGDEELAFVEHPPCPRYHKYIWCEFKDRSSQKLFRPPVLLVSPDINCRLIDFEDQIDQLLAHLCSLTGASLNDCSLRWKNDNNQIQDIHPETDANTNMHFLKSIIIEMDATWTSIYKEHYDSNTKTGLYGLIDDFFREEQLDGNYHCLNCSKSTKALKKSQLCLPLPRILIIQFKRFTFNQYSNEKIDTFIPYPLTDLDLRDYIYSENSSDSSSSTKYDLVAVSNHSGTLNSGHYITCAKNREDQNWYSFDDRYVRKLDKDHDIITKNAYILIYVQK